MKDYTHTQTISKFSPFNCFRENDEKVRQKPHVCDLQIGAVFWTRNKWGHLAVYVGESEDEKQRVLVPVTYFNHPLLGKLLEDAEKVYGFDHPGVITIPCRVSEFERVQKIIATTRGYHRCLRICCSIK
ncbi:hypothetical protein JHK82_047449 [Glycine max]|nr:hypothetical protein JHK85_047927 [Glycine max]KAG5097595.1 hypothetical protein JHK82_047449 [Glycine max]KAG5102387.1 hypothetical protein JHK84_047356 [Glycine max]